MQEYYEKGDINKDIMERYFSTLPSFVSDHEGENYKPEPVLGKEKENPVMPYEIAELLLAYDIKDREDKIEEFYENLRNEAKDSEDETIIEELNQHEYDALLIHIYRKGSISKRMRELLTTEKNREDWEKEFEDSNGDIERRYQAEINLFFDGDYEWVFQN